MNEQKTRDPMRTLVTVVIVVLAVLIVAAVVFVITGPNGFLQKSAYQKEKQRIDTLNEEARILNDQQIARAIEQNRQQLGNGDIEDSSTEAEILPIWNARLDDKEWSVADLGTGALENTSTQDFERSDLINGGLLLVNAWHALPDDFSDEELIPVGSTSSFKIPVSDNNIRLFPNAYGALLEAITAAEAEGISHYLVREGYRSVSEQSELFNQRMEKLSKSYSGDTLIEKTKQEVNYPGTSDYHSGLSFRMDVWEKGNTELNNQKFQTESEQGKWLSANCWRYGIIFRFPTKDFPLGWADKSYKTGVSSQLNLYRYVGKAHAAVMKVLDLCLEEYIEFLIDHPHISVSEDGVLRYEIIRIGNVGSRSTLSLPVFNMASSIQASLDNMDGVVLAFSY